MATTVVPTWAIRCGECSSTTTYTVPLLEAKQAAETLRRNHILSMGHRIEIHRRIYKVSWNEAHRRLDSSSEPSPQTEHRSQE